MTPVAVLFLVLAGLSIGMAVGVAAGVMIVPAAPQHPSNCVCTGAGCRCLPLCQIGVPPALSDQVPEWLPMR